MNDSQELAIKQLEIDKEKIMQSITQEGDPYKEILVQQLMDMKIRAKKREAKKK